MDTSQIKLIIACVIIVIGIIHIKIVSNRKYGKPIPSKTCDIITPLNTYTDVKCNTVIFYNNDHIEFTYHNGQTVTVDVDGTDIKFN